MLVNAAAPGTRIAVAVSAQPYLVQWPQFKARISAPTTANAAAVSIRCCQFDDTCAQPSHRRRGSSTAVEERRDLVCLGRGQLQVERLGHGAEVLRPPRADDRGRHVRLR